MKGVEHWWLLSRGKPFDGSSSESTGAQAVDSANRLEAHYVLVVGLTK